MRIVSWNMNRLGRSESSHKQAWDYIQHELRADLALVQEASPPESLTTKVYSPIGEGRYNWGSAVVALRPDLGLKPRLRISLQDSLPAAVAKNELPDSHPGASAVADVMIDGHRLFTAISLYAPWEMMPGGKSMFAGPRLHRILSDLTGVLAVAQRNPVVLAGDLNVTSQNAKSLDNEASAVFARLRAWNLADCIALTKAQRTRLLNCTCPEGDACSHVQTFRRSSRTDCGTKQLDYAFISESIAQSLAWCKVEATDAAWQQSDHCPIVIEIDEDKFRKGA